MPHDPGDCIHIQNIRDFDCLLSTYFAFRSRGASLILPVGQRVCWVQSQRRTTPRSSELSGVMEAIGARAAVLATSAKQSQGRPYKFDSTYTLSATTSGDLSKPDPQKVLGNEQLSMRHAVKWSPTTFESGSFIRKTRLTRYA